jgi:hypothetical protein
VCVYVAKYFRVTYWLVPLMRTLGVGRANEIKTNFMNTTQVTTFCWRIRDLHWFRSEGSLQTRGYA